MFDHKKRLYVALYDRFSATTFHWSLLLVEKNGVGEDILSHRYHVTTLDALGKVTKVWKYDKEVYTNLYRSRTIVSLVRIGKVDKDQGAVIGDLVEKDVAIVQGDPSWTCRVWVSEAIRVLQRNGIVSSFDVGELESFCKERAILDAKRSMGKTQEELWRFLAPIHKFV